jgi:4-hydroxy-tetrahydrodipicolinate synthase
MASSDTAVLDRSVIGQASGIWAPVLTPLDEDLKADGARFVAHAKWLLDSGCHGLAIFGTTGEATSFSVAERIDILETALAAGLPPERMLVGTGCCALTDTIALSAHAAAVGCKNLLVLPPFYYKDVSDQGLIDSFSRVIDGVGDPALGMYLYHFPKLSAVPITHGFLAGLSAAFPGIVKGVKDSSGDPDSTSGFIKEFPDLAIFPGTESFMLPMLEAGAAGCISASCNVNGGAIRRVYDAWQGGHDDAAALQAEITAVRQVLQANPMIPTLKAIVAKQHDDPTWLRLRPPLDALARQQSDQLWNGLATTGFAIGGA